MNCPKCGNDIFELKADTHDQCSYLVSIDEDGSHTKMESMREEVGETDDHGNVVCCECGVNLRIGTWEILEPGEKLLPFSVLLLYRLRDDVCGPPETYFNHTHASDPHKATEQVQQMASEDNRGDITPEDFVPLSVIRGHVELELGVADFS